jgi:hypothetical protein
MRPLAVVCLVALAACATPRQACESYAVYDLRVVENLIAESEATLARGYALRPEPYRSPSLQFCYGSGFGGYNRFGFAYCGYPDINIRLQPVAVDLSADRAKLAELKRKRQDLARSAAERLQACRARYPAE